MSEEVREQDKEQPSQEDLEGVERPSDTEPVEKLGDEGRGGMDALTQQGRERYQFLKAGGRSGVSREFGKIDFFDSGELEIPLQASWSAMEIALTTPLGDKGPDTAQKADDAKEKNKSAEAAAVEFEKRGHRALADATKGLKYTTDGSLPRVIAMDEHYTLAAEKTPRELAEDRLGPTASKEQKEHYALILAISNFNKSDVLDKKMAAGTVLKLPAQTGDGGITYRDRGSGEVITEWQAAATLRIRPDGAGLAQYSTSDGWNVEVKWDARDTAGSGEDRFKGNSLVNIDSSGTCLEKEWLDSTDNHEIRRRTQTDEEGRTIVADYNLGDSQPHTVTITNADKSTVELKLGKDHHFVSADGKTGMDPQFNVYSRLSEADGSITRAYATGYKVTLDPKGRIVHSEGKDDWGRAFSYDYTAGQQKFPHTIRLTPKDGETPIEFKRQGNSYTTDLFDEGKKKIGTIELGVDSRIIYKNQRDKTQHTELKDGTILDKVVLADGTARTTMAKGGETQVTDYDNKGTRTKETSITGDNREFTKTFGPKHVESVTIKNTDGSKTELTWDKNAEQFRGERQDSTGKLLETVTLLEDKLIYTDAASGAIRGEKYSKLGQESLIARFIPGDYDRNKGIFSYKNSEGLKVEESFAPGRTDKVSADGSIEGFTVGGDKSTLKPAGEAIVEHRDQTGVRLNADNTIDRWGPLAADSASGEKLAPAEDRFVRSHADINRRDVAEIHRRFGGDNAKLDSLYKELEKIDSAKNLSDSEKSALRADLMHHVAFPQEIYQGRTPSCNVSVVERDMAMTGPDKYVATVVQAVSEGAITTPDGTIVPLDPDNLKMADSSGRDLASRIFQTTAIRAECYPKTEFRNSEDGVGRLYPSPYNPADKPATFAGMNMPHIADIRYKLTGEERGITAINNVKDLLTAFEANRGQPMIVAVDGSSKPFGEGGPVGTGTSLNHVVTITRIEQGTPIKVYVANQWGLESDHSTRETSIDIDKLVDNMHMRYDRHGRTVSGPGMVLGQGDHTKGYSISRGKVVENRALTAAIAKGRAINPGEK